MPLQRLTKVVEGANICNTPANLFVAGFIGSPPRNMLEGSLREGRFTCPAGAFGTWSRVSCRDAVAGIRPEDCRITAADEGKIRGDVYATELMGDHVLVTCRCGGATVAVKTDKTYTRAIGAAAGMDFDERSVHLFEGEGGSRIR